jgi:hypothetical protein
VFGLYLFTVHLTRPWSDFHTVSTFWRHSTCVWNWANCITVQGCYGIEEFLTIATDVCFWMLAWIYFLHPQRLFLLRADFLKLFSTFFYVVLNHNFVFVSFMLCVPAMVRSVSHQFHYGVVGLIPGHSLALFVVDELALGHVFLLVLRFSCCIQLFH